MKAEKSLITKILFLVIAFSFSACQTTEKSPSISPALTSNPNLLIENIDFRNFTYPYPDPNPNQVTFTLENGKKPFGKLDDIAFDLSSVEYRDLTGDNINEAVINLSVHLAVSNKTAIYIYTLENNKPKFLWTFWIGDQAAGGLKNIYSEDGRLIVEVFGNAEFKDNFWAFSLPKGNAEGICCPDIFTRIRFKWNGKEFALEGAPEQFDYRLKNQKSKS